MHLSCSPLPALRLSMAAECPKCRKYNLIQSDDPDIYYVCPDPACGYVLWANPPLGPKPLPKRLK